MATAKTHNAQPTNTSQVDVPAPRMDHTANTLLPARSKQPSTIASAALRRNT